MSRRRVKPIVGLPLEADPPGWLDAPVVDGWEIASDSSGFTLLGHMPGLVVSVPLQAASELLRWCRAGDRIWRLGWPAGDAEPAVEVAAAPDWPSALGVAFVQTGEHTVDGHGVEAWFAAKAGEQRGNLTADEKRQCCEQVAQSLEDRGRMAPAAAWRILAADGRPESAAVVVEILVPHLPAPEIALALEGWRRMADGVAVGDLSDPIAAAWREGSVLGGLRRAPDALWIKMADCRTWTAALRLLVSHSEEAAAISAAYRMLSAITGSTERQIEARRVATKLQARGHPLARAFRLLGVDPTDVDEVSIVHDDLAEAGVTGPVLDAWDVLADRAARRIPPSYRDDAFAAAWHALEHASGGSRMSASCCARSSRACSRIVKTGRGDD